jgi:hypothetical protein
MNCRQPYHGNSSYGGRNRIQGQQRLNGFGITMIVMGASFLLYYLGFFGSVNGPLNPAHIANLLNGIGITRIHITIFFLILCIVSVSWNWICNLVSLCIGARLTCERRIGGERTLCGAPVKREKVVRKRTEQVADQYVCIHGHKSPRAHFHSIKKGTISHSVWVISLAFFLIVIFA